MPKKREHVSESSDEESPSPASRHNQSSSKGTQRRNDTQRPSTSQRNLRSVDQTPSTSQRNLKSAGRRPSTSRQQGRKYKKQGGRRPKRRVNAIGVKAVQEIKRFQSSVALLLRKAPFARLLRQIVMENHVSNYLFQAKAILAMQEAAEYYIVHLFEDTLICALHAGRVTIKVPDMRLALRLRERFGF